MTVNATARDITKRQANARLNGIFARTGVCVTHFARACEQTRQKVARWLSVDSGESMPLAFVRKLPREAWLELLRDEAAVHGAAVVALPNAAPGSRDMTAIVHAHKEANDVLHAGLVAFANGSADRAESTHVRTQIREAVAALLSLDLLMEEGEREGFVVLRKASGE